MALRVDILQAKTGVCLFEKVWTWSGVSSPQGVCKLILTFFQISRELGDSGGGVVNQILFEKQIQNRAMKNVGGRKSLTGKKAHVIQETQETIRLTCECDGQIIIGVFHDPFDDVKSVKQFAKTVMKEFLGQFGEQLEKMKELFESILNGNEKYDQKAILSDFSVFEPRVEHLRLALPRRERKPSGFIDKNQHPPTEDDLLLTKMG